jgi:hypothetical protein
MNKPCEYCGRDLPLGVDKKTRQQRSHHFATCKARPVPEVEPFAQRTWVGLTDEDMRSKFEQWHGANFVQPLDLYNNSYRNMHVRNRWQGWVAAHGIKENT